MTIKDDGKLCFECKKIGLRRMAHRIVLKYGMVCDEHFREHEGWPQLSDEARRFIASWKAKVAA